MPTMNIERLRADLPRPSSSDLRPKRKCRFTGLRAYAELDWEPWTQDGPTDAVFPSDESMCAAAEASRTAYSIMHLTKDQLIQIHSEEAFDGFEETMANLVTTAEMLRAVVQMIDGARGRMIASACACLQKRRSQNFAYRHGMDGQVRRKPLR
jgi:hypothetical protein